MRKSQKERLAHNLLVADSEPPLVWVTTLLPVQLDGGWKRSDKIPDGCVYIHQAYGLASLRGIEDSAGRKWLHFSLVPIVPLRLEDIRRIRDIFFPEDAIVALAIPAEQSDLMHMWWSIDGTGLPMDSGWRAVVHDDFEDDE